MSADASTPAARIKIHLEAAIAELGEVPLADVRGLLAAARRRVEDWEQAEAATALAKTLREERQDHVGRRRGRRDTSGSPLTAKECHQAVLGLDRMIRDEQKKLTPEPGTDNAPQDLQTILG